MREVVDSSGATTSTCQFVSLKCCVVGEQERCSCIAQSDAKGKFVCQESLLRFVALCLMQQICKFPAGLLVFCPSRTKIIYGVLN